MIGERLGTWMIYQELGRGGMGRVYLAQEELSGRKAAIKVLAAELAQEGGFLERFEQEIESLRRLDHPNIVKFLESGEENGLFYFVMEYVEGKSLERVLDKNKRLPWSEVLGVALQVCAALKHAHDHGIIHRDLKPSNLLRTDDGSIKLSDFGVAKVFAGGQLTATGTVVGTADYISPEQASGKPVTPQSDLYSLGVMMYVLLTGRSPFPAKGALEMLHKHMYGQFDPPNRIVPDIPYELNDVVCQLMEKDPSRRPINGMLLGRELEGIRRKLDMKDQQTEAWVLDQETKTAGPLPKRAAAKEGPATFMSRMMRQELERQNKGGPFTQFFNNPIVIVIGLLLCISGIAYAFWPPSAATLFREGEALMKTGRIAEMETAFANYFVPLEERFPDHPYAQQIKAYRVQLQAAWHQRDNPTPSIVAPILEHAKALQEQGRINEAKKIWYNVIRVFATIPSEKRLVDRAKAALARLKEIEENDKRWQPLRQALKRAAQLRDRGQRGKAEDIWRGIEQLYGNDPSAQAILNEVKIARAKKTAK